MDLGLTDKRALVMASSRGLGRASAEALAREGARVLLTGRSEADLAAARDAIAAAGGRAEVVVADAGAPGGVEAILAAAEAKLGGIDILVGNTGGPPPKAASAVTPEDLHAAFHAIVAPVHRAIAGVLPGMRARGWGRIAIIASSGVVQPLPNLALSNALRPVLAGFAKTLAAEVAADGVTVNMVLPGRIATDRVAQLDAAAAERQGRQVAEVEAAARAAIPAGRYGRPEEFAAAVAFLCSESAAYVTGTMLRVDGGQTRSVF